MDCGLEADSIGLDGLVGGDMELVATDFFLSEK